MRYKYTHNEYKKSRGVDTIKQQTTIRLTPTSYSWLGEYSKQQGISVNAIIQQAVNELKMDKQKAHEGARTEEVAWFPKNA